MERTGRLSSRPALIAGLLAMLVIAALGVYSWYTIIDQQQRAGALGLVAALEVAVSIPTLIATRRQQRPLRVVLPRARGASYVGLDIGSHSIKAVQVRVDQGRPKVVRYGLLHTPEAVQANKSGSEAATIAAIRGLFRSKSISPRRMSTALSGQNLVLRHIQIPKMSEDELREMLRWESEQYIPIPKDESVYDYHIVPHGRDDEQMQVVLVAAYRKQVDELLSVVGGAGAQLDAIDIEPLAVYRALQAGDYDLDQFVAIINIGAVGTNLSLFNDGLLQLTRVIPVAGGEFTRAVAQGLSLSLEEAEARKYQGGLGDPMLAPYLSGPAERLTSDICRSVEFYLYKNRELSFPKVYLVGGSARLQGLMELLRHELQATADKMGSSDQVTVELAHPAQSVVVDEKIADEFRDLDTVLAPALGLALREVGR